MTGQFWWYAARSTGIPLSVTPQAEEAALASLGAEDELRARVAVISARRIASIAPSLIAVTACLNTVLPSMCTVCARAATDSALAG